MALDNLPTNANNYAEIMPLSVLIQDLKHAESLIKNTMRSYSAKAGEQCAKLGAMYLKPKVDCPDPAGECDGSVEWILARRTLAPPRTQALVVHL